MNNISKDIYWAKLSCSSYRNFKIQGEYQLNFACPICGDSKKDKKKARGVVYVSPKGILKYKCHNCDAGPMSIKAFLKDTDPIRYREYIVDVYGNKVKKKRNLIDDKITAPIPTIIKPTVKVSNKDLLVSAWDIPEAKEYLNSRLITKGPIKYHENFFKWVVENCNRQAKKLPYKDPRVVLECRGENNELIGYIGRSLGDTFRYNNVKINHNYSNLVYGLDGINKSTQIRVVEGAFDSLFVDNCIAISSSALPSASQYFDKDQLLLVFDNEPRAYELCTIMKKAIDEGFSVVIWPDNIKEKDINLMVLAGIDVNQVISENTYKGLSAKLKFNSWNKT